MRCVTITEESLCRGGTGAVHWTSVNVSRLAPSAVPVQLDRFAPSLLGQLEAERVAAVITLDDASDAVPLARALRSGGLRLVELAWRTEKTLASLEAILAEVPGMLVGVGTLLTASQVEAAARAGAHFGLSPGIDARVVAAARDVGFSFVPGVQTPSDILAAIGLGCGFLKFFPAETAGGVAHLRTMHAPFAHLGLRYLPLGGISEATARDYLIQPSVVAVGGSWIAPAPLVRARAWPEITLRAKAARALADSTTR